MAWKLYLERRDYTDRIAAMLVDKQPDGIHRTYMLPLQMEVVEGVPLTPKDPTLEMDAEEATSLFQGIVDACWDFGIRPTGVEDFKRTNDAQGAHLKDMRALVGKLLDAPLT